MIQLKLFKLKFALKFLISHNFFEFRILYDSTVCDIVMQYVASLDKKQSFVALLLFPFFV